jgi:hypothetical protein
MEVIEIIIKETEVVEVVERGPQGPQGVIQSGDIEITNPSNGLILHSPDDNRWRITIDNDGVLTVTGL